MRWVRAQGAGSAGPVLQHGDAVVLAGQAAVQAGKGAGRDAAAAGEESVRRQQRVRGQGFRHPGGSTSC